MNVRIGLPAVLRRRAWSPAENDPFLEHGGGHRLIDPELPPAVLVGVVARDSPKAELVGRTAVVKGKAVSVKVRLETDRPIVAQFFQPLAHPLLGMVGLIEVKVN